MKRRMRRKQQTFNRESNMQRDDDTTTNTSTTTTFSDGEKKENDNKASKKVTVSLALDEFVVEEIRKEAGESYQSFNAKINAILEKYVRWYRFLELNKGVVIPPQLINLSLTR